MTQVINTPEAFARAAETLHHRDLNRKRPISLDTYMRPSLVHACLADPEPKVTRNLKFRPKFDPVSKDYVEPPRKVTRNPPRPPKAFLPVSLDEGSQWTVSCASTRYPLFTVRGTARHAEREAQRYCEHYGIALVPPPYRLKCEVQS